MNENLWFFFEKHRLIEGLSFLILYAAAGIFHTGLKPVKIGPGYSAYRGTYLTAVSLVYDSARFAVGRRI